MNESTFFWLHHTDSFLKLAMASDRLRDLLIIACTGARAKRYGKNRKPGATYPTPFDEAGVLISKRGISEQRSVVQYRAETDRSAAAFVTLADGIRVRGSSESTLARLDLVNQFPYHV